MNDLTEDQSDGLWKETILGLAVLVNSALKCLERRSWNRLRSRLPVQEVHLLHGFSDICSQQMKP